MHDVNGYRAKFGSIIPSTNTTVERDFGDAHLPGVTFHSGRIYVPEPNVDSAQSVTDLIEGLHEYIAIAFRDVLTCLPDYVLMGMSAPTFWGGKQGSEEFVGRMRGYAGGLEITTGAMACLAALETLKVRDIAVISPYQPIADEQVEMFFTDYGFDVKRIHGLRCTSMTSIAQVTTAQLVEELKKLDGSDVEAIVQVGTDLSMVRLADEAEHWLGKPVIAINAATLWHGLRAVGIQDRLEGFGSLLRDY